MREPFLRTDFNASLTAGNVFGHQGSHTSPLGLQAGYRCFPLQNMHKSPSRASWPEHPSITTMSLPNLQLGGSLLWEQLFSVFSVKSWGGTAETAGTAPRLRALRDIHSHQQHLSEPTGEGDVWGVLERGCLCMRVWQH